MDREALIAAKQAVVDEHGAWTSHNVSLPHGLFTIGPEANGDNLRAAKFLQIAGDVLRRPLNELRVLDLACLEGLYGLEFAQHGARVVGIEGRAANLAKAEFARGALGLDAVEFVQGDVRDASRERYGGFDVIVCSGILYHLDRPDVFHFLEALRPMCDGVLIIDTRIALKPEVEVAFAGRSYWGSVYREHAPALTPAEKLRALWSSLDNDESFWFTRASLTNLLADLGWGGVYECLAPAPFNARESRAAFVAVPARDVGLINNGATGAVAQRRPEQCGEPS